MILQVFWIILLLLLLPIMLGMTYSKQWVDKHQTKLEYIIISYLLGWLIMMAVFFVLALIITFTTADFSMLAGFWAIAVAGISIIGIISLWKNRSELTQKVPKGTWSLPSKICLIAAVVLVIVQIVVVTFMQHSDADDAWYVGQALTDLYTDTVGVYAGDTGIWAAKASQSDYIIAPWPVLCAVFSKFTGVAPAIMMHTVLPFFLILLAYSAYFFIGREMFGADNGEIAVFVMIYALINIFAGYSTRSPSVFLLFRVWQGKAIMASVLLPLFLALLVRHVKAENATNAMLLLICNLAIMLTSGSGMLLSGIIWVSVTLADLIELRSIKKSIRLCWIIIPNIIIVILFFALKRGLLG